MNKPESSPISEAKEPRSLIPISSLALGNSIELDRTESAKVIVPKQNEGKIFGEIYRPLTKEEIAEYTVID